MSGQGYGVVCEIDGDRVKLFDFWTKKMVDLEAPKSGTRVHIGDIRRTDSKALAKVGPGMVNMSCGDFGVDPSDGALLLKTIVVCPRIGSLDEDLGEYEKKVFSYLFEFVNDPRKVLTPVFEKGGFRWVLIKFNPQNGNHFEVVKMLKGGDIPGYPKKVKEEPKDVKEEPMDEEEEPVFKVPQLPMGGPGGLKIQSKKH